MTKENYTDTLNLSKTKFPMAGKLQVQEKRRMERWNKSEYYLGALDHTEGRPVFRIFDGPPYANGKIHIGHALNKILKDIINRSKLLSGYQVRFQMGWDCHGVPVEILAEKEFKNRKDLPRIEWIKKCREVASRQVQIQIEDLKKLGLFTDFNNIYKTMDPEHEARVVRSIAKMASNGYIFADYKPVNLCSKCSSPLSDSELVYKKHTSRSLFIKFQESGQKHYLLVWTTTPWTISENKALAVNGKMTYLIVQIDEEQIILSEYAYKNYLGSKGSVISTIKGSDIAGRLYISPLTDEEVVTYSDDMVSEDEGTGIVHIAPAHGKEDFLFSSKHNIQFKPRINTNGTYIDSHPLFSGESIYDVTDKVISLLKEKDLLFKELEYKHDKSCCWRHPNLDTFQLATMQWFINMNHTGLREQKKNELLEGITSTPSNAVAQLQDYMKTRKEWCISRQRVWGIPIPLFVNRITGRIHADNLDLITDISSDIEQGGIESYFRIPENYLEGHRLVQSTIDVWLDSGLLPLINDKGEAADLIIEGTDQYRGWFQSTFACGAMLHGKAAFKHLIVHGFVVDKDNQKMSKSLGNTISVTDILGKYSAELLRMFFASRDYTSNISISYTDFDNISTQYRKIRNVVKYLLSVVEDEPYERKENLELVGIDQIIITTAKEFDAKIRDSYNAYRTDYATKLIYDFCNIHLSSQYIKLVKDRQYTINKNTKAYRSIVETAHVLLNLLIRWIAPILISTTEEILEHYMPNTELYQLVWYKVPDVKAIKGNLSKVFWQFLLKSRESVMAKFEAKDNKSLHPLGTHQLVLGCSDFKSQLEEINEAGELRFFYGVASVTLVVGDVTDITYVSPLHKCSRCWNYHECNKDVCKSCKKDMSNLSTERLYF